MDVGWGRLAEVFVCACCGQALTAPVSRVVLPSHSSHSGAHSFLPSLMEPGTYAVRRDSRRRGREFVCSAGDSRGTVLVPELSGDPCLGIVPGPRPNVLCAGCGTGVGERWDDCGIWNQLVLLPRRVRRRGPRPGEGPVRAEPTDRVGYARGYTHGEDSRLPALTPDGHWEPRWEAEGGAVSARLLAASGGMPLRLPAGLPTRMFDRLLRALLPYGPAVESAGWPRVAVAGPGLPPHADARVLLVPADPRTGLPLDPVTGGVTDGSPRARRPRRLRPVATPAPPPAAAPASAATPARHGPAASDGDGRGRDRDGDRGRDRDRGRVGDRAAVQAGGTPDPVARTWAGPDRRPAGGSRLVPVAGPVWRELVAPTVRTRLPVSGGLPPGVEADDPVPNHPTRLFQPSHRVLTATLERLPEAREAWFEPIRRRLEHADVRRLLS
ncbi:hypothetical protein ACN20G_09895 [Streptomyces sp. BI20]|uniref:hypothetical protein n=1 Tax=Streptomyces sp. BI20 TaxID=3403460 RepID=UPI003C751CB1